MIFGASGLLGKALLREWTGDEVSGLGSRDPDIRNLHQVSTLVQHNPPDWIVLAAAYTDVDGCETDPELAFDVNCRGAVNVALAAREHGSKLLFLSTDYVFDGSKTAPYEVDEPRAPLNVYGRSKAEAEKEIARLVPECCIVRTSWLFGVGGKCFPDTILKLAATRSELDVVDDQRGCPTYASDLASTLIQLCRRGATGILHATNRGECSWFDFAKEIISASGLTTIIRPTTTDRFIRPATRPKYSVLSGRSLEKYGVALPCWRDAVRRYVALRKAVS
jgi:dTDP-4-dehydrorhamnose reductase